MATQECTLHMNALKAGLLYFALVFSAGYILGTVRVLWIAPRLGTRTAELLEAPVMITVSFVAARWVVRRLNLAADLSSRLGTGLIALALMLAAEFGFMLWVRGLTFRSYFVGLDPVAGTVYWLALAIFALMPMMVARPSTATPITG
jgi:hypothetical protein